jgi:hypothetical protein
MADKKISQLTAATTPLAGTEVLPIVQSGSTVKVSAADVTAGRAVSALSLTLTGSPLAATSGGTGQSSAFTANGIPYASSTSALATGSTLTFNGTTFSAGASSFIVDTANTRILLGLSGALQGDTLEVASKGNAGTISLFGRASDNGSSIAFRNNGATTQKAAIYASDTGMQLATGTTNRVSLGTSGDVTVNTGNLIVGTAAKGIDFSANTGAAGETSSLLNWYEEGTWTPTQGAGLTVVGAFTSAGTYTRIGRQVTVRGKIDGATSVACAQAAVMVGGLPFAAAADTPGTYFNGDLTAGGQLDANSTNINAVGPIAATTSIYFTATYFV